jgi:hypothetical protein
MHPVPQQQQQQQHLYRLIQILPLLLLTPVLLT